MRSQLARLLLGAALVLTFHRQATAQTKLSFDYSQTSDKASAPYDKATGIVLTNVNTFDYEYKVNIEAIQPSPTLPVGGPVGPSGGLRAAENAASCKDLPAEPLTALQSEYAKRLGVFGESNLTSWRSGVIALLDGNIGTANWCQSGVAAAKAAINGEGDIHVAGQLTVDSGNLLQMISKTAPGGSIAITVTAAPRTTTLAATASTLTFSRALMTDTEIAASPAKDAILKEKVERKFTVTFDTPVGIVTSFGPYLALYGRQTFAKVTSTSDSTKQVIGTSEDSNINYGIAAYWNVIFVPSLGLGVTWGIAYNPQNQLDTAVSGLLGIAWTMPNSKLPFVVNSGLAVVRNTVLSDGHNLNDPIDPNATIPTTVHTTGRFFVGLSFTVGGK